MGKKGPLWWRESDWLLRGSSAANQILLRHSGPILSLPLLFVYTRLNDEMTVVYSTPLDSKSNQSLTLFESLLKLTRGKYGFLLNKKGMFLHQLA